MICTRVLLDPDPANNPPAGGITAEEHKAAIEKARLEERTKLRQQIELLETRVSQMATETEAERKAKKEAESQLELLRKVQAPNGQTVDVANLVREVSEKVRKSVEGEYTGKLQAMETQVAALTGQVSTFQMEQLRNRMIAEAGGTAVMIVELVTGANEVELSASIAKAKQVYADTVARIGGGTTPAAPAGTTSTTTVTTRIAPPTVSPPAVPGGTPAQIQAQDAGFGAGRARVSTKDWAVQREAKLAQLRQDTQSTR